MSPGSIRQGLCVSNRGISKNSSCSQLHLSDPTVQAIL